MPVENAINIYADGSSGGRPRVGGIGIHLVIINTKGEETIEDIFLPGYPGATNNQMELQACIEGIKKAMCNPAFDNYDRIFIYTDSSYVVDNHEQAFFSWSRNKWRNYQGRPMINAELWKELLKIIKRCPKRVKFIWVKGHAKDQHNKAADKLAKQSARNVMNRPLNIVKVRRKLSRESVDIGSVPMKNQRISIRIIADEYLRLQRCYRFKYEVISKSSPYYGKIDLIYSEIMLNAGHCYSVRFNDNAKNPTIIKKFKELPKTRK